MIKQLVLFIFSMSLVSVWSMEKEMGMASEYGKKRREAFV